MVLCVAAHDIGEYVRHYPRGKSIIEQFQGKQAVMRLLSADDPNVRYHALLAVQKLMVHNWEYLGKQLESEKSEGVAAKSWSFQGKSLIVPIFKPVLLTWTIPVKFIDW